MGTVLMRAHDCAQPPLLPQEAELVRLQSQATTARRRLKAATAATLGELVDRYSCAAAAWGSPGGANRRAWWQSSSVLPAVSMCMC